MVYGTRSIKAVIDKISRDLNLPVEDRWVSVIEWSAEVIEHAGVGSNYTDKEANLTVRDYKALFPCDFISLISVSKYNNPEELNKNRTPLIYSTANQTQDSGLVYTVNGSWLNTGFKEGKVILFYKGLSTDEEGFPLIPNDISYLEACFWYCTMKLILGGYENKVINYQFAEDRYQYYLNQAKAKHMMPTLDKMESLKRQWLRIIPMIHSHNKEFTNLNSLERAKI